MARKRIIAYVPRKRRRRLRQQGFKTGNTCSHRRSNENVSVNEPESSAGYTYVRLTETDFNSRIDITENDTLTFKDVDGQQTNAKPLRPAKSDPSLVQQLASSQNTKIHPDLLVYKLYRPYELQVMWNSEIRNHKVISPECEGDLQFDAENSCKWGVCWSERLICSDCQFESPFYKLYEEVNPDSPNKRGRKAASANVGLQLGLMSTPISNTSMRKVLLHSKMIPPTNTAMQKQANKVGKMVTDLNKTDMKKWRHKIKVDNAKCGHAEPDLVRVEGDCRYNN